MSSASEDPVKSLLFSHVSGPGPSAMASQGRWADLVRGAAGHCLGPACREAPAEEAAGRLATALLHHMLTASQTPSQRKVELGGVPVDVVVPDLRTLESDPLRAVLVCIPATADLVHARARVAEAARIQPVPANLWAVSGGADLGCRTFVLGPGGGSFAGMMGEIARFGRPGRLRILGAQKGNK